MPIIIDGKKYLMSELEGTDIKAIHDFMTKSKSNAAFMVYVDDDGNIQSCGTYKTKKALNLMQEKCSILVDNTILI